MMDYAVPKASQMPHIETAPYGHAVAGQSARRQGRGRGRHHRLGGVRGECGLRCAGAFRDPAHRQAADPGSGLGGDQQAGKSTELRERQDGDDA